MTFTKEDLKRVDETLRKLADESYRDFQKKLMPGVDAQVYGVRMPALRKLVKPLIKADWRGFLKLAGDSDVYEITMLCGMVIALSPCGFEEKLAFLEDFIPRINNWAVCDTVCADLKDVKQNRERMFAFLQPYFQSSCEYEVRFAAVILLQYFLTEEYIDDVLHIYDEIRHDGYYVKMAVAWGISLCFIQFRDITLAYMDSCTLDDFTYNKSIQKMVESFRVSDEDKRMLRGMRRRK